MGKKMSLVVSDSRPPSLWETHFHVKLIGQNLLETGGTKVVRRALAGVRSVA
jgi:hypothetical protein